MYGSADMVSPFWGASASTKGARDPLGVQNSSVVIYSNMITGITNVTARVRYNGFFCWLITLIAKRLQAIDKTKTDDPKEQIKYLRRGELLLAYMMHNHFPEATGVSGSFFVQRHNEGDIVDLSEGADCVNTSKVYWNKSSSVFEQYYIGVLSQLRLVFIPDNSHYTYRVTEDGMRLNEIFRQSLSDGSEDLFWSAIYSGKIEKEQLANLICLALHMVGSEAELKEYESIFSKPDRKDLKGNDVCHRIESIKLLLRFINEHGKDFARRDLVLSFLSSNFETVIDKQLKVSSESLSWFLYELNELTHAAYEAFHFAILNTIKEEPRPLDWFLEQLKDEFLEQKEKTQNSDKPYELYKRLQQCYKNRMFGAYALEAARLIGCLKNLVEPYIAELTQFANDENYDVRHPGFAPSLLLRLTAGFTVFDEWEFAENCFYRAINAHQYSSYNKSSIGQGLVHKYFVDEGLIWRRSDLPEPIRTSPRLQNVLRYIEDIHWIASVGDNYQITNRGKEIMKG